MKLIVSWIVLLTVSAIPALAAPRASVPKPTAVDAQTVLLPPRGSRERTEILDALRPSGQDEDGSGVRFIVHTLREVQGRDARFAYASVEPSKGEYDGGDYILENRGQWRVIWSVAGGGSNSCGDLAAYYLAAIHYLMKHGAAPDLLAPNLQHEQKRLAACDPDLSEVGDMGPAL